MSVDVTKLTDKELKLYEYLKTHEEMVVYMSIRDLAQAVNISTATVLRLMEKMGYSGFTEYKYSLKKETRQTPANDANEIIQCLTNLEQDYYKEQLDEMAMLMRDMNVIIFHGIGSSAAMAQYGARKFSEAGMFAFSSNDPFFINPRQAYKRADIFLSITGETPELLDLAMRAPDHLDEDSFSLAITASLTSTLAKLCDYAIAYPLTISKSGFIVNSSQIITVAIIERLTELIKKYNKS